jgi:hypothetical protein
MQKAVWLKAQIKPDGIRLALLIVRDTTCQKIFGEQSQKPAREQGCRNREILNSFVFNYNFD